MPRDDFERRPLVAIWEVTRACDLRCLHCRASAMPRPDPRELAPGEARELVGQLRDLDPAVLVLTGGDPLKRPDLLAIVRAAVDAGLNVAIAPSVTPLLTAGAIRRLADAGVRRVALSVDGPDASTHDALRGTPGSFVATRRAIDAVRAAGLPLQVNTSLTRRTAWELPATGARIAALAPVLWSVFYVVPVGRADPGLELDAATCEATFHYLDAWRATTGLAVKTTAAPAFRRVVLQRDGARPRAERCRPHPPAVNDGKGFVFVSHTGDVYPSGFLPLRVGSVRRAALAEIYRSSVLMRALRVESLLEGKCGACPFRAVCGGSRARAFAATGNLFAEDPACAYEPPTRDAAGAAAVHA
jgi:radical SAM protein with 4Fe4S-binding SPASM domain